MGTLVKLDPCGDIRITWNEADPADVDRARQEVAELKSQGYSFFLVDGSTADEVAAGRGTLNCRRVEAEEIVQDAEPAVEPKRRGRPPGPTTAVAVRPVAGGR